MGDRCAERGPNTEMFGDAGEVSRPLDGSEACVPRVQAAPTITNLTPIEISEPANLLTPTVYLGIGRSAGRVLLAVAKETVRPLRATAGHTFHANGHGRHRHQGPAWP